MSAGKKKVNLTISDGVLEKAKRVAELRGDSLSALVEDFLARLVSDNSPSETKSFEDFYRKYTPSAYAEPSDEDIARLKAERIRDHS